MYYKHTIGMTTLTAAATVRASLMIMMIMIAVLITQEVLVLVLLQVRKRELSQQMVLVAAAAAPRGWLHDSRRQPTALKQQGTCTQNCIVTLWNVNLCMMCTVM